MKVDKRTLKGKYRELFNRVSAILFEHDFQGINYGSNDDEYDPEVGTILPRLKGVESAKQVQKIVYEEFSRWFGEPGEFESYEIMANEIWAAWSDYRKDIT